MQPVFQYMLLAPPPLLELFLWLSHLLILNLSSSLFHLSLSASL